MPQRSTAAQPSPEPSSSSSSSDRIGRTNRPYDEDDEDERLRQLPDWVRPAVGRLSSVEAVVAALRGDPFGFPAPDAIDLAGTYGPEVCEGAILKTQALLPGGTIRSPRRWLVATLKRKLGWRPDQIRLYIASLIDEAVERMETSESVTDRRIASELRRERGEGPENVVELRRAQ